MEENEELNDQEVTIIDMETGEEHTVPGSFEEVVEHAESLHDDLTEEEEINMCIDPRLEDTNTDTVEPAPTKKGPKRLNTLTGQRMK